MSKFDSLATPEIHLKLSNDTKASSSELVCMADWIQAAAKLPGKSLHVGVALWFSRKCGQSYGIELGNCILLSFGVDRNSKYRALKWLENANLISVERRTGFSPLVMILPVGDD